MPEANDNIDDAGKQYPHVSDQVSDSRDYDGHIVKNDRDRRRW